MHLVPGRLRLRSESLKGDVEKAEAVHQILGEIRGIQDVKVSVITGSITIFFDQNKTTGHAILNFLIRMEWVANVIPFPKARLLSPGLELTTLPRVQYKNTAMTVLRKKPSPQLMNKIVLSTVKFVLPILVERYLGKSASRFVASVL